METDQGVSLADLKYAARQLVAQKDRPSQQQLSDYFTLAQGLPDLDFDGYYELERCCLTPRFREVQEKVEQLLGY